MYKYPYGDSQQLNLDWIIAKLKDMEAAGIGLHLEEVSNALISLTYNTSTAYRRYDYTFLNGKLYRCLTDTTGAFDPAAWQEALIGDDLAVLTRWINAIDAAAVVDVRFDTSGTNGKIQQKYHEQYHDVVEVDYTPVRNSKRPISSNAGYELNGAVNNIIIAKRISTIDDLSTSENHFVTFAEDVSVGGITFPQYSKGVLVTNMGTDASLYAIGLDGKLYTAYRSNNTWRCGKAVTNEINDLNDAINSLDSSFYAKGSYSNEYMQAFGHISGGATEVLCTALLPKILNPNYTVTITQILIGLRTVNGSYVASNWFDATDYISGTINVTATSLVILLKAQDASVWGNQTNNTPVTGRARVYFTIS